MKKGLLFVPFMTGRGGTETVIKNLFTAYNESTTPLFFNLTVYSIGGSEDYSWARPAGKVVIKRISSLRKWRTAYYATCLPFYLFNVIKKERPDFIISTNPIMWFLSFRIVHLLRLDTKVIAWYHYSLTRKPIYNLFLRAADAYLAISDSIRKELIQSGIPEKQIFTIYNPITTDRLIVTRPTDGVARFIYLGRIDLDGQKNLRDLISACTILRGKWTLDLFGDEADAQSVKNYVHEKRLESNVTFCGFVESPWKKIKRASALILCSNFEGYPMVLAEGMSHGVFCIASDIEGSNELVNSINGDLYELHNYRELASEMQKVINFPEKLPDQKKIQSTVTSLLPNNYLARFNQSIKKIFEG